MDKLENLLSLLTTEEKGRSAGGLRRMLLEGQAHPELLVGLS